MGAGTGRGLGGSPTRGQRLSGGVDGMGRYSESMASKGRGEGGQERGMLNGSSSYAHNEVANGRSNDESSHGTGNWWEDDMPHPHEASAGGDEQRNRLGQQQAYYPSTSSVSPAPPLLPLDHRFSPNPSYRTLNANGANTASLSNYPSSGSSSSPSLLLSPLSPFVEPFSPTMTGAMNGLSIGGSTWGLGLAKGSSQVSPPVLCALPRSVLTVAVSRDRHTSCHLRHQRRIYARCTLRKLSSSTSNNNLNNNPPSSLSPPLGPSHLTLPPQLPRTTSPTLQPILLNSQVSTLPLLPFPSTCTPTVAVDLKSTRSHLDWEGTDEEEDSVRSSVGIEASSGWGLDSSTPTLLR